MDRIPVEVYCLIVSMIEDEERLKGFIKKGSDLYWIGDFDASSISNASTDVHWNNNGASSSAIVRSITNMQRMLQDQIAALRKTQLVKLIHRMGAILPTKGKNEDGVPHLFRTGNRLATLKSLRLCNKRLSVNTAEAVFEEVVLHFRHLSHSKLEAISQHPYKDYVRVLHIVPKAISGPLLSKKEFGRWLRGERTLIDDPLVRYAGQGYYGLGYQGSDGHLSMPIAHDISQKTIDFHYAEYSSIHAKQQKLFVSAEAVLQAAISRLPKLKRVESGLYWEWSRRREDTPTDDFEHSPGRFFWVGRADIPPKDKVIERVWKIGACQENFDMDQGAMILRAIARGKASSGARIDVGPLFRHLNIMVAQIANPEEKAVVNALMEDAKHFNFSLTKAENREAEEDMSSGKIVTFLQSMRNLESLRFQSEALNLGGRIGRAFGNLITWPHLTRLSITRADYRDFEGLTAFICRHKASLRQLVLYDFYYRSARRCNLFATMHAGTLDKVKIWSQWLKRTAGEEPVVELHEAWITFTPHHVDTRGTWSPRLESDLRDYLVAKLFPSSVFRHLALLPENDEFTEDT